MVSPLTSSPQIDCSPGCRTCLPPAAAGLRTLTRSGPTAHDSGDGLPRPHLRPGERQQSRSRLRRARGCPPAPRRSRRSRVRRCGRRGHRRGFRRRGQLSLDPTQNVAGIAAESVLAELRRRDPAALDRHPGVRLRIHKQMPLASGLGSSAASSVAGAMAVNELYGGFLTRRELLVHALAGERAASGSMHADNAAPCLLGGFVLIRSCDPLEVIELPTPPALRVTLVHPHCRVETAKARALLRGHVFTIDRAVANLGNLGALDCRPLPQRPRADRPGGGRPTGRAAAGRTDSGVRRREARRGRSRRPRLLHLGVWTVAVRVHGGRRRGCAGWGGHASGVP